MYQLSEAAGKSKLYGPFLQNRLAFQFSMVRFFSVEGPLSYYLYSRNFVSGRRRGPSPNDDCFKAGRSRDAQPKYPATPFEKKILLVQ